MNNRAPKEYLQHVQNRITGKNKYIEASKLDDFIAENPNYEIMIGEIYVKYPYLGRKNRKQTRKATRKNCRS